jgi:hypothetical protein
LVVCGIDASVLLRNTYVHATASTTAELRPFLTFLLAAAVQKQTEKPTVAAFCCSAYVVALTVPMNSG